MEAATDPEMVFDLRRKLDAAWLYDQHEVDRVAAVEIDPKATHSQLASALEPVADKLVKKYSAARKDRIEAQRRSDEKAAQARSEKTRRFAHRPRKTPRSSSPPRRRSTPHSWMRSSPMRTASQR
ncbi:MAG: hypothetical protein ACJAVR_002596 [Paracoccaceae bacterium]|jgi:hypothetical protein